MLNQVKSRRTLLAGAAALLAGAALAGCSSDQIASAEAQWNSIVSTVQSAVAKAAAYVPTVESIVAQAAALFGPQYSAIVQIGSAALNTVIQTLINVVSAAPLPKTLSRRAMAAATSGAVPVTIGQTAQGVIIAG